MLGGYTCNYYALLQEHVIGVKIIFVLACKSCNLEVNNSPYKYTQVRQNMGIVFQWACALYSQKASCYLLSAAIILYFTLIELLEISRTITFSPLSLCVYVIIQMHIHKHTWILNWKYFNASVCLQRYYCCFSVWQCPERVYGCTHMCICLTFATFPLIWMEIMTLMLNECIFSSLPVFYSIWNKQSTSSIDFVYFLFIHLLTGQCILYRYHSIEIRHKSTQRPSFGCQTSEVFFFLCPLF